MAYKALDTRKMWESYQDKYCCLFMFPQNQTKQHMFWVPIRSVSKNTNNIYFLWKNKKNLKIICWQIVLSWVIAMKYTFCILYYIYNIM